MPGYVIGLDLGHRCVKAAVLKGSFRGYEVEDFLSLEPEQPEDGGAPTDEAILAAARAILDTVDQPQATIVVALPAGRVSTWLLEMPFSDAKRLEATLPFEVENYVPWDLDTVILDYEVIEKGPPAKVFAAMAPRERVAGLLEGLQEIGIDPRYVTVDAGALAGLAKGLTFDEPGEESEGDSTKAGVILDIGATRTLVSVCPDGQPRWLRSLDRGAEFLGKYDRDPSVALEDPDDLDDEARAAEALRQSKADKVLRSWLSDVRASLLAAEDAGFDLAHLMVCGGGARRDGLLAALTEATGLEASPLPMPPAEVETEGAPAPEPEHALAYALARRAFVKGHQPVDFRKEEFAWQADSRLYIRLGMVAAVALLLLAIGGLTLHFVNVAKLKGQIEQQNELLTTTVKGAFPNVPDASLASERQAIAVVQENLSAVQDKVEALQGHGMTALDALRILSEAVPANVKVDVNEFLVNDEMIRIQAQTDSFQSIDSIEAAIQGRPGWTQAETSDQSKNRDGTMRFVVTIPRDPAESEDEG